MLVKANVSYLFWNNWKYYALAHRKWRDTIARRRKRDSCPRNNSYATPYQKLSRAICLQECIVQDNERQRTRQKYAYWSMKWLYLQMARSQSVVKVPFHPFYLHFILHNLHNLYIRLLYTHSLHTFYTLCFIHYMCFVCILRLHPCAKRYVLFRAISSSIHYYGIQASL